MICLKSENIQIAGQKDESSMKAKKFRVKGRSKRENILQSKREKRKQTNVLPSKLRRKSEANYLLPVSSTDIGKLKEDAVNYVITEVESISIASDKPILQVPCVPKQATIDSSDDPSKEKLTWSSPLETSTPVGNYMVADSSMTDWSLKQPSVDANSIPEKRKAQINLPSTREECSLGNTVSSNHCPVFKKLTEYDWSDISDDENFTKA